jgi:hypothetical protein
VEQDKAISIRSAGAKSPERLAELVARSVWTMARSAWRRGFFDFSEKVGYATISEIIFCPTGLLVTKTNNPDPQPGLLFLFAVIYPQDHLRVI